jgi:hypothetical protein
MTGQVVAVPGTECSVPEGFVGIAWVQRRSGVGASSDVATAIMQEVARFGAVARDFLLLASCNLQEVTRFGAGAQRGFLLFADCAGHNAGPDGCRGTYCFLLSAEWRTFFRA